jgi:hypothetical protein
MATFTLFGQAATGTSLHADTNPFTIGVQFSVSSAGTLDGLWWYSATGAGALPQTIALFTVSGQALAHSESASWSGAAGSGWVFAAFSSPPSLTASTAYEACVLQTASADWYSFTANYWTSGAGGSGITSGPLSSPGDAAAVLGNNLYIAGASLAYPTSVSGFNFWVDPQVTSTAATTATLAAAGSVTAKATQAAGAPLAGAGTVTAVVAGTRTATANLAAAGSVTAAATQVVNIRFVQGVHFDQLTAGDFPFPMTTTAGSTLILAGSWATLNGTTPANLLGSITDTAGNPWTYATTVGTPPANVQTPPAATNVDGVGNYFGSFVAWSVAAAPVTGVTIHPAPVVAPSWFVDVEFAEFSGVGAFDSSSAAQGVYAGGTTGVTCHNAADLIVIGMDSTQGSGTVTQPSGFTLFPGGSGFQSYLIGPGATGTISWSLGSAFTNGQVFTHAAASFLPSAGPSTVGALTASDAAAGGSGAILTASDT